MSTHRPYRPALGFREALHEIKINSGIKYDSKAANAAINLFHGANSLERFFELCEET